MAFNKETIRKNSASIYHHMQRKHRYTFEELQRMGNLESTPLCLALLYLMQERKIEQEQEAHTIYYVSTHS